jgi:enoyl-CoA hydratase/carnithine racemase
MKLCTDSFMTLFKSSKPTIAKVHGAAIGGGSDIALCCDLLVMAEDARIGGSAWGGGGGDVAGVGSATKLDTVHSTHTSSL